MLRALWNIFDALRAPREDLSESVPPAPGISTPAAPPALTNGMSLQPQLPCPVCLSQEGFVVFALNNGSL